MKHKLYILLILILASGLNSFAQPPDFSGLKIMINPGHGGHDSNDRGMPNGFWESDGNLTKGLWLRDLLESRGCDTVVMSRVLNRTEDDLPLSQIAAMANTNEVDLFISIHSNAANQVSNFPLTIFNGKSETPTNPEAKVWAKILWEHLITNKATHWTSTSPHYIGDLTLNPSWTSGYGVLWPLQVPGIISEGSFHDHQPEVDRLLNLEYRKQEAWNMMYAMVDYFNLTGMDETGNITGIVRDSFLVNENYSIQNSPDKYLPVNGVEVEILETGEQYLIDQQNTGFYYFDSIPPGDYHLIFSAADYYTDTLFIQVIPHQHNHLNYWIEADKSIPPKILDHNPGDGELINCFDPIRLTFSMNMDSASFASAFSILPTIDGSFIWDKDYLNVDFQPNIPYETNSEYIVFIDSTAEHQWGVSLDTTTEFSFTTDDRNRYNLELNFPANDQQEVSPYLQFRLIFDAPINNTSLINAVSIISSTGDTLSTKGATITSIDNKGYYYFSPEIDLDFDEEYILQLTGSIKDEENIPLVDTIKIPFHTRQEIDEQIVIDELENTSDWSIDFESSLQTDPSSFLYRWGKTYRSGSASLLFRYTFLDESAYCIIKPTSPIALLENSENLNLWLWGDLSQYKISIGFNNETEVDLGQIDFAGWDFLSLSVPEGVSEINYLKVSVTTDSSLTGDILFDALSQENTTGIYKETLKNEIRVYPNPLDGNILQINGLKQEYTEYSIYSMEGKLLQLGIIEQNLPRLEVNSLVKKQSLFVLKLRGDIETSSQLIFNLE